MGTLQTAAYVYTEAWWLQLLCMAMLAWRVSVAAPWRAAGLGLVYGTAWLIAGTWWLFISMHRYGGLPAERLCRACLTGEYPTKAGERLYQLAMRNRDGGGNSRTYEMAAAGRSAR